MQTVEVGGLSGRSRVLIGEPMGNLPLYAPVERTVILTDEVVLRLYGDSFPPAPVICIGQGETSKTLKTVLEVYRGLIERDADRSTVLVGIGGGIVCDVAGFAASTYLRGIPFGFAATTLLAQVDASLGGKNGVNLDGYKNMVGTFTQPGFVLCDPAPLRSLPKREIGCGLAEIVKHAAIADQRLFERLEAQAEGLLDLDPRLLEQVVADSVRIKAAIVGRDEREAGERRKLNFGHTFGHAVEKVSDVPHGEAVAQGMALASALSVKRGLLPEAQHQRLVTLLRRLSLPFRLSADLQEVLQALAKDKKRLGERIHFVLLEDLGRARVEPIALTEIEAAAESLLS